MDTPPLPSPPESVRGVCASERLPLLEQYAAMLATDGVVRGLIGPREVPRLWDRHIANSAILSTVVPEGITLCDVGTGAGLPGMVVAIVRPDLKVTLVEPLLRRTTFLDEVVEALGLDNVEVVRGRADALHGSRTFDMVTSRAVAPLDRLLEWSMPLVAPEGELLALKGSSIADEIENARPTLEKFRCDEPVVVELGTDVLESPTYAVRVSWADPSALPLHLIRGKSASSTGSKSKAKRRRR
ncbi:ribosomal RNA small subunit methyltransferase G [Nocardioides daphniae]|uniref:Ribosomal RNA small subunit methyltransferase G n=1 Tax=Nocardioides daphniae TaxID=402297 RepID=A0A4P7UE37_9ACTN|nr:16S rRNA (guanine(527)-N(7))-methyltransferase RsmG [Nocardioides daphniae]GGD11541.1 ribosomal RNA small subunit methyltransferase G [Nocardioides daphniae]